MNWIARLMDCPASVPVYAFCGALVVLGGLVIIGRQRWAALVMFWVWVFAVLAWADPACGIASGGGPAVLCAPSGPAIPALSLSQRSAN